MYNVGCVSCDGHVTSGLWDQPKERKANKQKK